MSSNWGPVTPNDVVSRWRPLNSEEAAIVDAIIADSQDILETEAEDLGITAPVPGEDRRLRTYVRIVANMVIRVLKNPDGILTETIDDYTYRRDSAISSGALYVSDDELNRLRPYRRRTRGAFSVMLSS